MKKRALGIALATALAIVVAPSAAMAATPPTVSLGSYNASTNSFASAEVTGDVNTLTVSVSGGGKIADASGAASTDLNNTSATFIVTSASAAQEKLRSLVFSGTGDDTVIEVTADGNTTTELPSGAKVTQVGDHYYMWVGRILSWSAAYNEAKTYRYNGMQGYLATITSEDEYTALRSISTEGSWIGGTLMVYNDGLYSKIEDQEELWQRAATFTYKREYGSAGQGQHDIAYSDYYWACGPEAGTSLAIDTHSDGEPNAYCHTKSVDQLKPESVTDVLKMTKWESCLVANNEGTNVINDIIEPGQKGKYTGYFVEFGGYPEGEDPGNPDSTLTTAVSYRFTHQHGDWSYSASGSVLTATCGATDGTCDLTDRKVSLTLSATGKTYDGQAAAVSVGTYEEQEAWKNAGLTIPTVTYRYRATTQYRATTDEDWDDVAEAVNAGYYKAYIAGDDASAEVGFTISKRPVTVSGIKAEDKTYDGTTEAQFDCDDAVFDAAVERDLLIVTAAGTFSDASVGDSKTVTISKFFLDDESLVNYELNTAGSQTTATAGIGEREVTLTWGETGLTYNGGAQAPTCEPGNTVEGDDVSVAVSGAKVDAGEGYEATASLAGTAAANYKLPDNVTKKFSIARRAVTVSGIKAEDKTYDGTTDARLDFSAATFGNAVEGDVLTVSATSAFANRKAGTGKTVAISGLELGGASAANYKLAATGNQESTTASIGEREVTLAWGETGFTYNGGAQAPACEPGNTVEGDDVSVAVGGAKTDAGEGYEAEASLTGTDAANYKLPDNATKKFSIARRAVTVSGITAEDKTYDGTTDAQLDFSGATFANAVEGDALTVSATGAFANRRAGTGKTVAISGLELGGASAANYELASTGNQESTTASIGEREVTLAWGETGFTYNGGAQAPTCEPGNTVEGDDVSVFVGGAATDAGDDYEATASLTGTDASNYKLPDDVTKKFSIARKDIADAVIELGDALVCNDTEQEQAVKSVTVDGLEVTYDVSGNKVTAAGDYTLTVTGTGNFKGEATKSFTVAPNPDQVAADKVAELIEKIGTVGYNDASEEAIEAARKAYDALTDEQKKRVDPETVKKLEQAENEYKKLDDEVRAAEDAISKIGDVDYNDASKEAIEAARKAYDALTDEQKKAVDAKFPNALEKAEKAYAEKKAAAEKEAAEKAAAEKEKAGKKSGLPGTGDVSGIAAIVAAMGTAAAALGITAQRRRS